MFSDYHLNLEIFEAAIALSARETENSVEDYAIASESNDLVLPIGSKYTKRSEQESDFLPSSSFNDNTTSSTLNASFTPPASLLRRPTMSSPTNGKNQLNMFLETERVVISNLMSMSELYGVVEFEDDDYHATFDKCTTTCSTRTCSTMCSSSMTERGTFSTSCSSPCCSASSAERFSSDNQAATTDANTDSTTTTDSTTDNFLSWDQTLQNRWHLYVTGESVRHGSKQSLQESRFHELTWLSWRHHLSEIREALATVGLEILSFDVDLQEEKSGWSAIHSAVAFRDLDAIDTLLAAGCDCKIKTPWARVSRRDGTPSPSGGCSPMGFLLKFCPSCWSGNDWDLTGGRQRICTCESGPLLRWDRGLNRRMLDQGLVAGVMGQGQH